MERGVKWGEPMQDMPKNYFYSMALGRDLKGYSIGPHTDTADKWVTTLYYLPRYVLSRSVCVCLCTLTLTLTLTRTSGSPRSTTCPGMLG